MLTPGSSSWKLGKFTVRSAVRIDNPLFPQYLVYVGLELVGKSFSVPDLGCCQFLERQRDGVVIYAEKSAKQKGFSMQALARRKRPETAAA